jgi:ribonuclease HII
MIQGYRMGADENGLGARLGPMVVTAVLARIDERGQRFLARKLPKRVRADLDDSKRLVSHGNVALGEAWARALCGASCQSPDQLFRALSFESESTLEAPCPKHARAQCWTVGEEPFSADDELVARVGAHLAYLAQRGVEIRGAKSSVRCTRVLNDERIRGGNRFVSDLHAMERLTLAFRKNAGQDLVAICGKVGGMADYSRFFGPLSGRLHAVMAQGKALSAYKFPGLGELHFKRDADAGDPLVMLASLIGKYVRELLMARISRYYEPEESERIPSGYHDPVTASFVVRTAALRRRRRIPKPCFEREGPGETR